MGSMGTGEFGKISDAKNYNEARCLKELPDIELQEVANSEYYHSEGQVPDIFSAIYISRKLKHGRLQILLADDDREIGLLPSQFSYLHTCLAKGHTYSGTIIFSENTQFPKIAVKLDAK